MTPLPTSRDDPAFHEMVARVRARRELVSQAIADGKSDIVPDRPLTADERHAIGLDDDGDEANEAAMVPPVVTTPRR